jgi:hypothetical protein
MSRKTMTRTLALQLGAAVLLAGFLAIGFGRWGDARGAVPNDWQIEDLVTHLRQNGLELRAVPTFPKGSVNHGAFLTTTDQSWQQLNTLHTDPDHLEPWKGTVFCTRAETAAGSVSLELWEDGGTRVGPFVLFGDPELRARIQKAL